MPFYWAPTRLNINIHSWEDPPAQMPMALHTGLVLPPRTYLISAIERQTKQKVIIITNEDEAQGKYAQQLQSPLFQLPRELRDIIWAYATVPYEDPGRPFPENVSYYRPGRTASLQADFALLLTCRRIWLETNALPMQQSENYIYWDNLVDPPNLMISAAHERDYVHRAAPDRRASRWMAKLTDHNLANLGTVHLQGYDLNLGQWFKPGDIGWRWDRLTWNISGAYWDKAMLINPRISHVTLRHCDWRMIYQQTPLKLNTQWVQTLLDAPVLRATAKLKISLEAEVKKADQLDTIVAQLSRLQSRELLTHLIDGEQRKSVFRLEHPPLTSTWRGSANFRTDDVEANPVFDGHEYVPYYPYSMRSRKTHQDYNLITLSWNLHFPDADVKSIEKVRRTCRLPTRPLPACRTCGAILGVHWHGTCVPRQPTPVHLERRYVAQMAPLTKKARARAVKKGTLPASQDPAELRRRGEVDRGRDEDVKALEMRMTECCVECLSLRQSSLVENARRERFEEEVAPVMAELVGERWEREACLLGFEGMRDVDKKSIGKGNR